MKPERLGLANIKILISLSEPEHAIKSIVNLFAQKDIEDLYASPVEAANYYIARVKALAGFSGTVDQPYYYFDAEMLQRAPEKLLPRMRGWLELDSPLSERYEVFSQTGKPRRGDTSARVRSGNIDRTRTDYSHVVIPQEALSLAHAAYEECRARIIARAADSATL